MTSSPALQAKRPWTSGAAFGGVPGDLVGAIAEDGGVDLGIEVELVEVVLVVHGEERALGGDGAGVGLGRLVGGVDGDVGAGHEVGGGLVDDGLRVVEDEAAVARAGHGCGPLVAVVEGEVIGIGAQAVAVHAADLLG